MVLADRDNYTINIGKRALFNVYYGGISLSQYSFLQVDVISKKDNSLGYISGQVNLLTGLPSLTLFRLTRAKSIVEGGITFKFSDFVVRSLLSASGPNVNIKIDIIYLSFIE